MNCKDCCYNLPKDGHSYCTYEDGECVKISVLEKENAELKNRNVELKGMYAHSAREAGTYKQFFEQKEKENAKLKADYKSLYELREEENKGISKKIAELKEQCSILADCNTCVSDCKTENIEIKKQLTKAKFLLKQLVDAFPKSYSDVVKDTLDEARKFVEE